MTDFLCKLCGQCFAAREDWARHVEAHKLVQGNRPTPAPALVCQVCHKQFKLKQHFTNHACNKPKPVVGITAKNLTCKVCDKTFKRESHLRKHELVHTGQRAFACEGCKKRFTRRDNMMVHMRRKCKAKKKFACNECDAAYFNQMELRLHCLRDHDPSEQEVGAESDLESLFTPIPSSSDEESSLFSAVSSSEEEEEENV